MTTHQRPNMEWTGSILFALDPGRTQINGLALLLPVQATRGNRREQRSEQRRYHYSSKFHIYPLSGIYLDVPLGAVPSLFTALSPVTPSNAAWKPR